MDIDHNDTQNNTQNQLEVAYLASGCFWGTEYYLMQAKGVKSTSVGYMGGHTFNPTYREVCTGTTGHVETVKVVLTRLETSFERSVETVLRKHIIFRASRGLGTGHWYTVSICGILC